MVTYYQIARDTHRSGVLMPRVALFLQMFGGSALGCVIENAADLPRLTGLWEDLMLRVGFVECSNSMLSL